MTMSYALCLYLVTSDVIASIIHSHNEHIRTHRNFFLIFKLGIVI